jgi:hypothetical protein
MPDLVRVVGRSAGLTYFFGNGSYYEGDVDAFGM